MDISDSREGATVMFTRKAEPNMDTMPAMGQAQGAPRPDKSLATIIREARKDLGVTQEQLATLSGVGRSTLRRWETGEITDPALHQLRAVAAVLHLSGEAMLRAMGWSLGTYNLRDVRTKDLLDELQRRYTKSYELGRNVDGGE